MLAQLRELGHDNDHHFSGKCKIRNTNFEATFFKCGLPVFSSSLHSYETRTSISQANPLHLRFGWKLEACFTIHWRHEVSSTDVEDSHFKLFPLCVRKIIAHKMSHQHFEDLPRGIALKSSCANEVSFVLEPTSLHLTFCLIGSPLSVTTHLMGTTVLPMRFVSPLLIFLWSPMFFAITKKKPKGRCPQGWGPVEFLGCRVKPWRVWEKEGSGRRKGVGVGGGKKALGFTRQPENSKRALWEDCGVEPWPTRRPQGKGRKT